MSSRVRNFHHKAWTEEDSRQLVQDAIREKNRRAKRDPGMKGAFNWKRIAKKYQRTSNACAQQWGKIQRGLVPGITLPPGYEYKPRNRKSVSSPAGQRNINGDSPRFSNPAREKISNKAQLAGGSSGQANRVDLLAQYGAANLANSRSNPDDHDSVLEYCQGGQATQWQRTLDAIESDPDDLDYTGSENYDAMSLSAASYETASNDDDMPDRISEDDRRVASSARQDVRETLSSREEYHGVESQTLVGDRPGSKRPSPARLDSLTPPPQSTTLDRWSQDPGSPEVANASQALSSVSLEPSVSQELERDAPVLQQNEPRCQHGQLQWEQQLCVQSYTKGYRQGFDSGLEHAAKSGSKELPSRKSEERQAGSANSTNTILGTALRTNNFNNIFNNSVPVAPMLQHAAPQSPALNVNEASEFSYQTSSEHQWPPEHLSEAEKAKWYWHAYECEVRENFELYFKLNRLDGLDPRSRYEGSIVVKKQYLERLKKYENAPSTIISLPVNITGQQAMDDDRSVGQPRHGLTNTVRLV